ncbi:MAG TPA: hypothetical protein VKV02_05775, partial [Acidobacteriaceae bacterium]|nr:hypothetical protein [Acidobacteriaceae bacterium]
MAGRHVTEGRWCRYGEALVYHDRVPRAPGRGAVWTWAGRGAARARARGRAQVHVVRGGEDLMAERVWDRFLT